MVRWFPARDSHQLASGEYAPEHMNVDEYHRMYELEDSHWWFVGRRRLIAKAIETYITAPPRCPGATPKLLKILDAGCGTGRNLQMLARYGDAHGLDHSELAIQYCRRRGLQQVQQASVQDLPLDDRRFDLVTLLDVLYHQDVADDAETLRRVHATLCPGGFVLITEPAFNWLHSTHDQALGTRRRYTRLMLRTLVESAGFEIFKLTYANFALFPIVAGVRLFKKAWPGPAHGSDVRPTPPIVNAALAAIFGFESKILAHTNFPWGSSLLCVARRID
ncbi:MAG: class I SAM-dependent methyltransferase [Planctomycetes bacterium]|nr:class I SAM-dependent methyltransferase [Planctomycetota bacterium]